MKKVTWNFIIDIAAFISFLIVTISGFVLEWGVMRPGQARRLEALNDPSIRIATEFWNLTRHQWRDIHFYVSIAFVVLVFIHMAMHWNWIKARFKTNKARSAKE